MMRASTACMLLLFSIGATTSGCTTGGTEPAADELKVAQGTPAQSVGRLELGPMEDEDLRQIVYKGLSARLAKTLAVGEDAQESTEIGDYESFRFTIIKLTRGNDDVSGDPRATADGMDVETSGWFKRTVNDSGDSKTGCTSFDAVVTLLKIQGDWSVSDENPVTFGREDAEDCY